MQYPSCLGLVFVALCLLLEVQARPAQKRKRSPRQSWDASSRDHVYSYDESPLYRIDDNPMQRDKTYGNYPSHPHPKPHAVSKASKKVSPDKKEDTQTSVNNQDEKLKIDNDKGKPDAFYGMTDDGKKSKAFGEDDNKEKANAMTKEDKKAVAGDKKNDQKALLKGNQEKSSVHNDKNNEKKASLKGNLDKKASLNNDKKDIKLKADKDSKMTLTEDEKTMTPDKDVKVTDEVMEGYLKEVYGRKYPYGIFEGSYMKYEGNKKGLEQDNKKGFGKASDKKGLKHDADKPDRSNFKFGNDKDDESLKKEDDKPAFKFGNDKNDQSVKKEDDKPALKFGNDKNDQSVKKEDDKPAYKFGNDKNDQSLKKEDDKPAFKFGNDKNDQSVKKEDDKPAFKFGNDKNDQSVKKEDDKPAYKFGNDKNDQSLKKEDDKPAFKFGNDKNDQSVKKEDDKPAFKFGNDKNDQSVKKEDDKPAFKFGNDKNDQSMNKEDDKPAFKFGNDKNDQSVKKEDDKPALKFGNDKNDQSVKKEDDKPAYKFGNVKDDQSLKKEDDKPAFKFGNDKNDQSVKKEDDKPAFKFGNDKNDQSVKKEDDKPAFKFGNDKNDQSVKKEVDKPAYKFGNDKNDQSLKKEDDKPAFKFGDNKDDKGFKDDKKENEHNLSPDKEEKSFKRKMQGDMPVSMNDHDLAEMNIFGEDDTEGLHRNKASSRVIDESGDINLQRLTQHVQTGEEGSVGLGEDHMVEIKSEMDPYRTPFDSQTSPNPPTTKPTRVTPMAAVQSRNTIEGHLESIPYETCFDDMECATGRVCLEGVCVCGDDSMCLGHKKPVCGSDGQLYPSHCELHRQACVQGYHIHIDHQARCLSRREKGDGKGPDHLQGTLCEYKVRQGVEATLWGIDVVFTTVGSLDECLESCDHAQVTGGCMAFEFSSSSGKCALYDNKDEIVYRPNPDMTFYDQARCRKQRDPRCEFEEVRVSAEQVFATCHIRTKTERTLDQCMEDCGGCHAFTYVPESGDCEIHNNKACTAMLDEKGVAHYVQKCDRTGSKCEYIEIIPGSAPFMCSTSSTTTENLVECHDACVLSSCEAFKYKTDDSRGCDLYFDKSCINMLDKRKENYYVRRCTNPEDCKYEEVNMSANDPCSIMSSSTDTIDQCRDACSECVGFKFDYQTGGCSLYNEESCLPDKKLNFYIIRCPAEDPKPPKVNPTEPIVVNIKVGGSVENPADKAPEAAVNEVIPQENLVIEGGEEPVEQAVTSDVKKAGPGAPKEEDTPVSSPTSSEVESSSEEEEEDYDEYDDEEIVEDDAGMTELQKKILGVKPIMEAGASECTKEEYVQFKGDLIRYHCVRFGCKDCDNARVPDKDYIATLMFSYYDRDMNGTVQAEELWETQITNNFYKLSDKCTLLDIMKYDDSGDGIMTKKEFIKAFDVPDEALMQKVDLIPVLATMGNGLEIQCGIHATEGSEIIWERHNIDFAMVSFPDIAVFSDGTLYFDRVGVHHTGNYTCYDRDRTGVKQIHQLRVQMVPLVKVSPPSQLLLVDNTDVSIHCHAEGIPPPNVHWEINEKPVPKIPNHYIRSHKNGTLTIYHTDYQRDTGAYKCVAENTAGRAEDVATIFIHKPNETMHSYQDVTVRESVYVFHKKGYGVYNPMGCLTQRSVKPSFGNLLYIPEELDKAPSLCEDDKPCTWGHAINVQDKYVYISQPEQNRVVVIDSQRSMNPVQFVKTDKFPVKLHYVQHLDQVWVLCWNSDRSTGSKTIVVIRDASKDSRHHMVHTQPIGYRFDLVQDMFLPPQNDLGHSFHYGYVIHNEQRGLFKLDLSTMRYTKAVDLSPFDCVPQKVAFIPIGGHIVVKCIKKMADDTRTLQILMDYVTDVALANITMYGTPYVSPDSRTIVTVDEVTGKVRVAAIQEDGQIKKGIEVTVASAISDVAFFPSLATTGYDLFLTSQNRAQIFQVNLVTGQVNPITDVEDPRSVRIWPWSQSTRSIVRGNFFSEYLATPSKSTLVVVNGRDMHMHCKFADLDSPDSVLFSVSHLG